MGKLIDLTGERFGRLTVIERAGTYSYADGAVKIPTWRCRCDCGKETVVIGRNLKSGATRSCGCIKSETNRANMLRYWREQREMREAW